MRGRLLRLRSDDQLVALFRAGDEEAFRIIHDRYRVRLFAYTRQMLPGARHDAEDALQDVFIRAYRGLRANDRPVVLRPWLYRVAHNRCIDHVRRQPAHEAADEWVGSTHEDPTIAAERREDLRRLVEDMRRLPEQQRSALLMREIDGMSYAELAEALDVSVPAVKSLLVRARMGLAQAGEARDASCTDIRTQLTSAYERGVRATGMARRHLRDCPGCRAYKAQVRADGRVLHALAPTVAPLAIVAKLVGLGGTSGSGGGAPGAVGAAGCGAGAGAAGAGIAGGSSVAGSAMVAGSAVATGSAAAGSGAVVAGGAVVTGSAVVGAGAVVGGSTVAVAAGKVSSVLAVALTTAGTAIGVTEQPAPTSSPAASASLVQPVSRPVREVRQFVMPQNLAAAPAPAKPPAPAPVVSAPSAPVGTVAEPAAPAGAAPAEASASSPPSGSTTDKAGAGAGAGETEGAAADPAGVEEAPTASSSTSTGAGTATGTGAGAADSATPESPTASGSTAPGGPAPATEQTRPAGESATPAPTASSPLKRSTRVFR